MEELQEKTLQRESVSIEIANNHTPFAELDEEATTRFGTPFARLDAAQADTILAAISGNERTPQTPLEMFFAMTKQATIQGYYSSEIGIHQELRYKGNTLLAEFVGCETVDGHDCPHCGQKAEG